MLGEWGEREGGTSTQPPAVDPHAAAGIKAVATHPAGEGSEAEGPSEAEARTAARCVFALNMAVLWSYQSLLAAQDLYEAKWPSARLSFVGIVSCSAAMCVGQAFLLATGIGERASFSGRLVPGYLAFAAIGAAVLARPSAEAIVLAFAATGALNCLTEAPLYSIAAECWPDERLTAALNSGNGAAGAANIAMLTLIRVGTSSRARGLRSRADALAALELSNSLFLSLMVLVNMGALCALGLLMRLPTIARRARLRAEHARSDPAGGLRAFAAAPVRAVRKHCEPYARVWRHVRWACACQLCCFVTTLALWPGVACATAPAGWFAAHSSWWCSPFIVGLFNVADLAGRLLAARPGAAALLPLRRCAQLTAGRVLLAVPLVLGARPHALFASAPVVGATVAALGLSNGLLATRTMCIGPELAPAQLRGAAAGLMVLALYWGIGLGALLGLSYGELALFRGGTAR